MSRPFPPRSGSFTPANRINGKIRAREVRVVSDDNLQLGVMPLAEAITLARAKGMDLVEVAATAVPPVCRIVDYGRYRYEQAKKEKESKKHQHSGRPKEIQLSASINAHDFQVKLGHAIDFLCEEMKVKLALRFRGREMMHQEFGRKVMARFIQDLAAYGVPIEAPKLLGKGLNAMVNPLPRNKRAANPRVIPEDAGAPGAPKSSDGDVTTGDDESGADAGPAPEVPTDAAEKPPAGFANNPFAQIPPPPTDEPPVA